MNKLKCQPRFEILKQSIYRRVPWRNGQGYTSEIAIQPEDANFSSGEFLFRISSASIASPSDFSSFPWHDRILIALNGDGLKIHDLQENKVTELKPFVPYCFSGDARIRAEPLGAPVTDFNVFTRKGAVVAKAELFQFNGQREVTLKCAPNGFVFAASGHFGVLLRSSVIPHRLNEGETLATQALAMPLTIQASSPTGWIIVIGFS